MPMNELTIATRDHVFRVPYVVPPFSNPAEAAEWMVRLVLQGRSAEITEDGSESYAGGVMHHFRCIHHHVTIIVDRYGDIRRLYAKNETYGPEWNVEEAVED